MYAEGFEQVIQREYGGWRKNSLSRVAKVMQEEAKDWWTAVFDEDAVVDGEAPAEAQHHQHVAAPPPPCESDDDFLSNV
jgi:hypothetical protein